MDMELWWNDAERANLKEWERNR